ncbi:MAG: hypothetical protein GVY35_01895 [Bacteroidetes bacterium]|jgi:hypothetical protein|nr:hypothetical protein [Bacteroidota bacterium]
MDHTTADSEWTDLGAYNGLAITALYRGREEPETATDEPPRFCCYAIRASDGDTVKYHAQTFCFEHKAITWGRGGASLREVVKQRLKDEAELFIKELIEAGHSQDGPREREVGWDHGV